MQWTALTLVNDGEKFPAQQAATDLNLSVLEELLNLKDSGEPGTGWTLEPAIDGDPDWTGFWAAYCSAKAADELGKDPEEARRYGKALAELLDEAGFGPGDMTLSEGYGDGIEVKLGREEWRLLTDDEATEAAHQYVKNMLDEMGIEAFTPSFQETIFESCCDDSQLEAAINESNESYWDDLNEADRKRELKSWCNLDDSDFEDEEGNEKEGLDLDDYRDQYLEARMKEAKETGLYQHMVSDFGNEEWIRDMLRIDADKVAELAIEGDGRGRFISGYDGEEHEFGDLYGYRTN